MLHELVTASIDPSDRYYSDVIAARSLLDRREVHLRVMIFNLRLSVTTGPKEMFYEDEFCFHVSQLAWLAFFTWDGESEPIGWAKHPASGRRGPGWKDLYERA